MKQVFINLLKNAMEAMNHGETSIFMCKPMTEKPESVCRMKAVG